jgi:hypothetical protein
LSTKTINRHAAGKHVPTRITVTLAALKEGNLETSDSDASTDNLSGDFNQFDPPDNDADPPTCIQVEDRQSETNPGGLPEIIQKAWCGSRSRLDEYQSDLEEEDFDDNEAPDGDAEADSEGDSEFDWQENGIRNGLGQDDLVDEDLQRVISEFGRLFFHLFITSYNTFTNTPGYFSTS